MGYIVGEHVMIIEDCRRNEQGQRLGIATGQTGTYEGCFDTVTGQPSPFGNPRIQLQDGSVIWGYQCWWRPVRTAGALPQEQEALEEHKGMLRKVLAVIIDQSD